MKLYFIPGLGFDDRVFARLNLPDYAVHVLNWIEPELRETLGSYTDRMAKRLPSDTEKVILVGHSLGGMISQTIASRVSLGGLILISTIESRAENPLRFRLIKPLGLHRVLNKELILASCPFWAASYGYETPEEQTLFKKMVSQHRNRYYRWALRALSTWKEQQLPAELPVLRLHGRLDQTFPLQLTQGVDHILESGSHLMVYSQGETISEVISRFISNIKP